MASQQAAKPFHKKILDPTKIPTWKVARRPPIENHSIIQGKQREQNSNAFKDHQAKEGTRLRKALNAITHGKNIFVYHNIRTNQVVYSLTRYLEVGFSSGTFSPVSALLTLAWLRKTASSANSSTTARKPSPPLSEKTCGFRTTRCTSMTPRSVSARTTCSENSPCSVNWLRPRR